MEKIVGSVVSKTTQKVYPVKWDSSNKTSWISRNSNTWEQVCSRIIFEEDAIKCAQMFIDSQPDAY